MHPEAMTPQALALVPRLAPTLGRHRFVLAGGHRSRCASATGCRSARRDFVDLYVIVQQTSFRTVAARALQRYGAGFIEPVVVGKGLTWFEDADGEPDSQYLGRPLLWDDVKAFFASSFRQFVLDLDAVRPDVS